MNEFENAMAMLVALEAEYSVEAEKAYDAFLLANGFMNSEVYDYCIAEGLLEA